MPTPKPISLIAAALATLALSARAAPAAEPDAGDFPRRLLFVSVTKYMYLNPLTQTQQGAKDLAKPAALRLAYEWRVPTSKTNNQVFILSDTAAGPDARLPMKSVVQGTFTEFFKTSRAQDRIVIYFGGHAIEKDGKAYLAPMEAEPDGEDWQASVIPLDAFYAELQKCKAAQKVVIWDVCRYNPEKGRVRPGSEPMTEALYKALTAPPAGIQALTTCKPGENALEFTALRPDGFAGPVYSGSSFLEAMKFVAEPRNNRLPKSAPASGDPIPVAGWEPALAKRVAEMAELAAKSTGGANKQTLALAGAAPAKLAAPDPAEKAAARFELPLPPKGGAAAEVAALEREFALPPIKPGTDSVPLADLPFTAEALKPFAADDVTAEQVLKDKAKYPFRAAVLDAFTTIRGKWAPGAGATRLRGGVPGPLTDPLKRTVRKEMEFWAVGTIELELALAALEAVADRRDKEPKRWQAHYDFAVASVKGRLAYMNEYTRAFGNLITDTVPVLDPKLGHDGWVLAAADKMLSGKETRKLADESRQLFQEIAVKYKGTPWAVRAKQEKSVALGLTWKPASLK